LFSFSGSLTYAKFSANRSAVNPKASTLQLFIDNSSAVKRQLFSLSAATLQPFSVQPKSKTVQQSTQKHQLFSLSAATLQPFSVQPKSNTVRLFHDGFRPTKITSNQKTSNPITSNKLNCCMSVKIE
jgi:hypothetical protein